MQITYLPLLRIQRDLYAMPRGTERFRAYIATMTDAETGDLALPLVAMNPMGKDHVPALLDQYLEQDADGLASAAVSMAASQALAAIETTAEAGVARTFRVALVMADDAKGGWTNRYCTEFTQRFESKAMFRRGWLVGLLWTSEAADAATACREALAALWRGVHIVGYGFARTLDEMMAQEGFAIARAGWEDPQLDADDLEYTRGVVTPYLEASDRATVMACLFGDAAARELGYPHRGISARAGLALALDDARRASAENVTSFTAR